ncbi:MAG: hypothetical protein H0V30_14425 [Chitinophagaceae bacterium]|nr:hypothetical protein [Chitinophagaceae bacterium]
MENKLEKKTNNRGIPENWNEITLWWKRLAAKMPFVLQEREMNNFLIAGIVSFLKGWVLL